MEPLKPDVKKQILANNPQAAPADIAEYERLLAERFMTDPNVPRATLGATAAKAAPPEGRAAQIQARESRLAELQRKLFGEIAKK